MNLITTDMCKAMLGVNSTDYDDLITLYLPIVSADVRRILNNQFNEKTYCDVTEGSDVIENIYDENALSGYVSELSFFENHISRDIGLNNGIEIGRVLQSDALEDGTYITAYDEEYAQVTISQPAIGNADYVRTGVTISMYPTIAKMIMYKISQTNTKVSEQIASKTMSVVSVSYDTNINKRWNYPQQLINDLGAPLQKVGI